jgi:hypothetical protein
MVQSEVTIALVTLMRVLLYYSGYSTTQGTSTSRVIPLLGVLYYLGYSYRSGYSVTQARIAAFCALKLTFLKVFGDIVALCATILAKYPLRPLNSGF